MVHALHPGESPRPGDIVVRRPRSTDALGHILRGAFCASTTPDDLDVLLHRLDRVDY